jgi:hypothetical protein
MTTFTRNEVTIRAALMESKLDVLTRVRQTYTTNFHPGPPIAPRVTDE